MGIAFENKELSREGGLRAVRGGSLGILVLWLIAACAGILAWGDLGSHLSSSVEAPGSESQAATMVLQKHFHESVNGSLLVLFEASPSHWNSQAFVRDVETSVGRAARAARSRAAPLQSISPRIAYAALPTQLSPTAARERLPQVDRAVENIPSVRTKVTGFPVISRELDTVIADDLRRAEAIAVPITAVILVLLFGSLPAVTLPLLFAFATISVAMGLVWLEASFIEIPVYATSVVTLVGIGLAVDYSMLYVARYREEVQRGRADGKQHSLGVTSRTAGRALIISGVVVAAGLIPLAFMPIPFFSGLGIAAIGIPLISVLAAMTLLPALLDIFGPHLERLPITLPGRKHRAPSSKHGLADSLANTVMRHPVYFALGAGIIMVLIALPAINLGITGGSAEFLRRAQLPPNASAPDRHFEGAPLTPYEVLIDSRRAGAAWRPSTLRAERRLVASLAADPGVTTVQAPVEMLRTEHVSIGPRDNQRSQIALHSKAERLGLVDDQSRFSRIRIVGVNDSGSQAADGLVERLRSDYVPHAGFRSLPVWVGGPAPADYDFVHAVTENIPILGLAIVVVMYCLLALMLRSAVLPLKAIAMSALSVAAACGVLVMVFEFGWGSVAGLTQSERINAWVPVLLFAALFGISTDYEIFMVTRMREEWIRSGNNQQAVKTGLKLISRVITASALVMIVIFAGFATSRVVALQEFGVGLVAGVFFDATVVRLLLVPSLMRLLGPWNWTFTAPPVVPPAQQTAVSEESH